MRNGPLVTAYLAQVGSIDRKDGNCYAAYINELILVSLSLVVDVHDRAPIPGMEAPFGEVLR